MFWFREKANLIIRFRGLPQPLHQINKLAFQRALYYLWCFLVVISEAKIANAIMCLFVLLLHTQRFRF